MLITLKFGSIVAHCFETNRRIRRYLVVRARVDEGRESTYLPNRQSQKMTAFMP
jgi:hypothetical protein